MGKNQHVVPRDGGWGVRGEGNSRLTSVSPTKEQAVDLAREIARNHKASWLSTAEMERYRTKTALAIIPVHRETGSTKKKSSIGA